MKKASRELNVNRICMRIGLTLAFALMSSSGLADSLQFTLIPASGNISGVPGSTIGWGYSITNQSAADWLVTTDLASDPFLHGTPSLLFDFPDIGPGQTVTETFNPLTGTGLYEMTWDTNVPPGFSNSGDFVLTAQWFDADPANGGNFIANATDTTAVYLAMNALPEPSTWVLVVCGLIGIFGPMRRRRAARQFSVHPLP